MSTFREGLSRHIPPNMLDVTVSFVEKHKNLQIAVVNDRLTRLGVFQPAKNNRSYHVISINGGLNPYAFIITLLHELAHLVVHQKYDQRTKPHGCEWQLEYTALIFPYLEQHLFPDDLHQILFQHFPFPTASSTSNLALLKALSRYDKNEATLLLSDLQEGETFIFRDEIFVKTKPLRSYCLCVRTSDQKPFRIHSLATVERLVDE